MNADVLLFFDRHREALPIYRAFEGRVLGEIEEARLKVQKIQITFLNRRVFAAVSFLPVRRAGDRPETWLTVTFGLSRRVRSSRIDAAVEPYPNRWTHHVLIAGPEEIDSELMDWVKEAARFSAGKR